VAGYASAPTAPLGQYTIVVDHCHQISACAMASATRHRPAAAAVALRRQVGDSADRETAKPLTTLGGVEPDISGIMRVSWTAAMADWATVASMATAGGTLVLAVATFASVRSANRSAAALICRPDRRAVAAGGAASAAGDLALEDPPQKIEFTKGKRGPSGAAGLTASRACEASS
jgi:hypothetical protein